MIWEIKDGNILVPKLNIGENHWLNISLTDLLK